MCKVIQILFTLSKSHSSEIRGSKRQRLSAVNKLSFQRDYLLLWQANLNVKIKILYQVGEESYHSETHNEQWEFKTGFLLPPKSCSQGSSAVPARVTHLHKRMENFLRKISSDENQR